MTEPSWLTTAQAAERAAVHVSTILRWSRLGLLAKPQIHNAGRHGRIARWPLTTPEQALWVKSKLERGFSFEEIRSMLEAGEFQPSPPGKPEGEG